MPSFQAIADAARSRFKAQVEDVLGHTVLYDNLPFTEPTDESTWIQFSVLPGEAAAVGIAGATNRYRTIGICVANVHTPVREGPATGLSIGDTVADAFRAITDTEVRFEVPSVEGIGRRGAWWVTQVRCPFYSDTDV